MSPANPRDASGGRPGVGVRVAVVDKSQEVRQSLRRRLQGTKYAVVGEAANGDEMMEKLAEWRPHLVLTDINAPGHRNGPGEGGIGIIKRLLEADENVRIVVLFDVDTKYLRMNAIKAGALSSCQKPIREEELVKALATAESTPKGKAGVARADLRLKKTLAVNYKKTTDGFFTKMRSALSDNISQAGMAIRTQEALGEKMLLKIEIDLPGQGKIPAVAKVVRSKPIIGVGMNDVGLAFTEIKPEDMEKIKSFILAGVARGEKAY